MNSDDTIVRLRWQRRVRGCYVCEAAGWGDGALACAAVPSLEGHRCAGGPSPPAPSPGLRERGESLDWRKTWWEWNAAAPLAHVAGKGWG